MTTLRKECFDNVVTKGENAGIQYFLFFWQYFLAFAKILIVQSVLSVDCKCFQYGQVQNYIVWYGVNRLPHNPNFWRPWKKKSFENFVGNGENAGTSIFSFSHYIFYPVTEKSHYFSKNENVLRKAFGFGPVKNFVW